MGIQATPALAAMLKELMGDLTHDEVRERGGPSSPTLTKILKGEGASISRASLRHLEDAFEIARGTMAKVARGETNWIRQRREELGMSEADLAEAMRAGKRTVLEWERGEPIPPGELRRLIATLDAAAERLAATSPRDPRPGLRRQA